VKTTVGPKRTWKSAGSNTACDTSAGYLESSPGKVSTLEQCKKSCEGATGCQSITFFKSGWCSHFSTACTKTNRHNKAVALRLSTDSGTSSSTVKTTVGPKRTWKSAGSNTACDTSAGYLKSSPGKVSTLEQCKKSCEGATGCQSITFFKSGWCSHFSTACTKTNRHNKAVALRLSADSGTSSSTTTAGPARRWVQVGTKLVCDTNAGEVYHNSSPGKVASVEECKNLCRANAVCKSIIFFQSGWCSHFSTPCVKTIKNNKAVVNFRLV